MSNFLIIKRVFTLYIHIDYYGCLCLYANVSIEIVADRMKFSIEWRQTQHSDMYIWWLIVLLLSMLLFCKMHTHSSHHVDMHSDIFPWISLFSRCIYFIQYNSISWFIIHEQSRAHSTRHFFDLNAHQFLQCIHLTLFKCIFNTYVMKRFMQIKCQRRKNVSKQNTWNPNRNQHNFFDDVAAATVAIASCVIVYTGICVQKVFNSLLFIARVTWMWWLHKYMSDIMASIRNSVKQ